MPFMPYLVVALVALVAFAWAKMFPGGMQELRLPPQSVVRMIYLFSNRGN